MHLDDITPNELDVFLHALDEMSEDTSRVPEIQRVDPAVEREQKLLQWMKNG